MTSRLFRLSGIVAVLLAVWLAHPASAQTNLVTNGSFAVTGGTTSFQFGSGYSNSLGESVAGWTTSAFNLVFLPGSGASQLTAQTAYGADSIWTKYSSGAPNTFNSASPTGGNFVAASSAPSDSPGAISQTINGLVVGKTYAVSFSWAGAQDSCCTGASNEQWQVTLGSSTQNTSVVNVASQGFSGWMNQTFYYVATSTSEVLSFLAASTTNVPPFALLANVSLTLAPEPPSSALVLTGLLATLGLAWGRRGARRKPVRAG